MDSIRTLLLVQRSFREPQVGRKAEIEVLHEARLAPLESFVHPNRRLNSESFLIFTTHDTSILDAELFRRDQVWFVGKDRKNASKIYPLSEFYPRKGEALEKGYLKGRYGALPNIDIENFSLSKKSHSK